MMTVIILLSFAVLILLGATVYGALETRGLRRDIRRLYAAGADIGLDLLVQKEDSAYTDGNDTGKTGNRNNWTPPKNTPLDGSVWDPENILSDAINRAGERYPGLRRKLLGPEPAETTINEQPTEGGNG